MKQVTISVCLRLLLLMVWLTSSTLLAQTDSNPRTVPVKFQVNTTKVNNAANISATLDGVVTTSGPNNNTPVLPSTVSTAQLEPGKTYSLTVTPTIGSNSNVKLIPPPGYIAIMDGIERRAITGITNGTKIYQVRVFRPDSQLNGAAGMASNLAGDRISWQVALGALRNGEFAGALAIVGSGTGTGTTPWDFFFTPAHFITKRLLTTVAPQEKFEFLDPAVI